MFGQPDESTEGGATPQDITTETSITIAVPAERIWETLTTPAVIKQWFFGMDTETDWSEGLAIVHGGEYQGMLYEDRGTIVKVEPGRRLVHTPLESRLGTARPRGERPITLSVPLDPPLTTETWELQAIVQTRAARSWVALRPRRTPIMQATAAADTVAWGACRLRGARAGVRPAYLLAAAEEDLKPPVCSSLKGALSMTLSMSFRVPC